MSHAVLGATLLALALGAACRDQANPAAPSSPSPSPSPSARPDSTLLENLERVRTLQRSSGGPPDLVALGGAVDTDGTVASGSAWNYRFGSLENNVLSIVRWFVWSDGRIVLGGPEGDNLRPPLDITEIGPALKLDSPDIIRLAREFGADPYYTRFSDARAILTIRYLGREPVAEIVVRSFTAPCQLGPIHIHAGTGALMARDLRCLDRLTIQRLE